MCNIICIFYFLVSYVMRRTVSRLYRIRVYAYLNGVLCLTRKWILAVLNTYHGTKKKLENANNRHVTEMMFGLCK